ncbi:Short-chain dehydrogenase [Halobacillus karajensis]|uniref:Diacetyl reductase [(S)-acetoin forming] n=1 Tax=Halobacillus karajensis TaxID=195088 RepID=A0A024P694_9BACI|nr:SDR family oxidoreductase [Halobacillus karajensis]CDQ20380.1 Diacetyl reductase [(S)-acetoin forming] [Halobacillus karajensis]CDQ24151.1 Diacetyl reductase [(S)-acetoin forming] [Halobacillus karajensis]CDQ27629.1 Diacetyl reductase [(S)-acetoin forming] [Halobacillus karajensis]SEH92532.1 Short-chain dehydrogenase [Halobacillus karajensis]
MKNVWITGAGTGLGRALAHTYAQNGYNVYLSGRTEKQLQVTQNNISQKGGKASVLVCDVTDPSSIKEAIKQIDHLHLLINNAGVGHFGELSTYTETQIDQLLNTNVKGTILTTQLAASKLKKTEGRVLNVISTAGLRGKKNESVYCASKFAIRGFTESLQKEWESLSLSATAVYMGGMNTPFWSETNHVTSPEKLKGPEVVAEQIFAEDDGRKEILIDR